MLTVHKVWYEQDLFIDSNEHNASKEPNQYIKKYLHEAPWLRAFATNKKYSSYTRPLRWIYEWLRGVTELATIDNCNVSRNYKGPRTLKIW